MIRRPPRSTLDRSSAASDVYKRQAVDRITRNVLDRFLSNSLPQEPAAADADVIFRDLSLIHISEPTRPY